MPLVDLLIALLWAGQNGLPPIYTRYFELVMQLSPHSSHRYLSTWGVVMLEITSQVEITPQVVTPSGKKKSNEV